VHSHVHRHFGRASGILVLKLQVAYIHMYAYVIVCMRFENMYGR
jgi:hypothetical protein